MTARPWVAGIAAALTTIAIGRSVANAAPVLVDNEKGMALNVGAFLQPQFQLTAATTSGGGSPGVGSPDGSGPSFDFFVRRVRLMAWGSVNNELSFFIDTDQPNIGKGGKFDTSMFVQDAFLTYAFSPAIKIDAGMLLVPFSRHTIEGAIGLHAIDYHAQLIQLPAGRYFRDTGVQLRGMLLDDRLHYRIGLFEGVRHDPALVVPMGTPVPLPLNQHGLPRVTGQVRYNILGSEPDFFLKGIYFSPTPLVSVGLGADVQSNAVYYGGVPKTYLALSLDAFAEYPLSTDDEILAKANVFYYGDGQRNLTPDITLLREGGIGFFVEVGYRHGWIEPLAYLEYLRGGNNTLELVAPHIGANFWLIQHNFNLKLDVGYQRRDALNLVGVVVSTEDILATLQAQLYF